MKHSEQATAVARETGWNLDALATDQGWAGVAIGPVGRHRDSDDLAESNWVVILADLTARFPDDVIPVTFGHWAVGWVEEIAWNAGNANLAATVAEWHDRLNDYPVADDEDFSDREYTHVHAVLLDFAQSELPTVADTDALAYCLYDALTSRNGDSSPYLDRWPNLARGQSAAYDERVLVADALRAYRRTAVSA